MTDRSWPLDDALPAKYSHVNRLDSPMPRAPTGLPEGLAPPPHAADSLIAVLWRSRWILLLCVLAAVGGGLAYVRTATPIYTSTARLYLDPAGIRISNAYDAGGKLQTDKYLPTEAARIRSMPVLTAAMEALMPQGLQTFSDTQAPMAYLEQHLAVTVGKKEETISISFRSPYPTEAADIVNRIVEEYMTSRFKQGHQNSSQVLTILQNQKSRARTELEEKRNELTEFQRNHMPLALGSDQGGGVMQQYLEIQETYMQAQSKTMQAAEFLNGVRTLAGDPSALRQYMQIRGDPGIYLGSERDRMPLEVRAANLRIDRESLLKTLTPDHPRVVELTTEIEQIESKLVDMDDRFVKAATAAAEQQYAGAKNYQDQVAQWHSQQQEHVVMLNAEIAQYQRLRSEVDQCTQRASTIEQEVQQIDRIVNEDVGQPKMTLEKAVPGDEPSEPRTSQVMAMAVVIGLLLGGGIAVTREWLNQTLRSIDEISATLGLPALGVIPVMPRRHKARTRGQRVFLHPESHESEAFRTIRTAVFFGAHRDKAKTLLVTSPNSGDGKSTLVSNLGIAMALAGQETLILDADMRRSSQHLIFGIKQGTQCLEDVLAGRIELDAAVQSTGIGGLSLLTCGDHFANPAEVLNSRQFASLLNVLTEMYDRVLVDAPPVTAVTDAQILGAMCDCTILVLKADKTTRKMARHSMDAMQNVGARILGVVVNRVSKGDHRYGYYGSRYRNSCSRSNGHKHRAGQVKAKPEDHRIVVS